MLPDSLFYNILNYTILPPATSKNYNIITTTTVTSTESKILVFNKSSVYESKTLESIFDINPINIR
jgi:hypothetical protein